jgi:hypothetical protein
MNSIPKSKLKILIVSVTVILGLILTFQAIRMNTETISQTVPVHSVGLRGVWLADSVNETIIVTGENDTHYFIEAHIDGIPIGLTYISRSVWVNHTYSWSFVPGAGWPYWINITDLYLFDQVLLGVDTYTVVDKAVKTTVLGTFEVWIANTTDGKTCWFETGNGILIAYIFTADDPHFLVSTNVQFGEVIETTDVWTTDVWTTEISTSEPTTTEMWTTSAWTTEYWWTTDYPETTEYWWTSYYPETTEYWWTTDYPETTEYWWTSYYPETTETGPFPSLCDDNPPEVTITGIEDDGIYSGTITIEFSVTDEHEITYAEITIEDGDIDETDEIELTLLLGIWEGSYELDTAKFPDGTYDVTIKVYDECDNVEILILDVTFENGNVSEDIPDVTPGFEGISAFLSLGTIVTVFWRRRRKK